MKDSLKRQVLNKKILPGGYGSITKHFAATDSAELFEENLKIQPDTWRYRTQPVRYTLNSRGYRTKEFSEIDWKNSIVLFGASECFGLGLDDSENISACLESITGIPVINMGVCGSSPSFAVHNATILKTYYPLPKAVVNIWSSKERLVFYNEDTVEHFLVGDNVSESSLVYQWNKNDFNPAMQTVFLQLISKQLWKDTKYFEATFSESNSDILPCKKLPAIDKARDLLHPGHKTAKVVADIVAENLNL